MLTNVPTLNEVEAHLIECERSYGIHGGCYQCEEPQGQYHATYGILRRGHWDGPDYVTDDLLAYRVWSGPGRISALLAGQTIRRSIGHWAAGALAMVDVLVAGQWVRV